MDAAVWTAIGLLATFSLGSLSDLGSRIDGLGLWIDARFNGVDARLDAVNARLDAVNARIDAHLDRHAG
jgi:hypothetical protein